MGRKRPPICSFSHKCNNCLWANEFWYVCRLSPPTPFISIEEHTETQEVCAHIRKYMKLLIGHSFLFFFVIFSPPLRTTVPSGSHAAPLLLQLAPDCFTLCFQFLMEPDCYLCDLLNWKSICCQWSNKLLLIFSVVGSLHMDYSAIYFSLYFCTRGKRNAELLQDTVLLPNCLETKRKATWLEARCGTVIHSTLTWPILSIKAGVPSFAEPVGIFQLLYILFIDFNFYATLTRNWAQDSIQQSI